MAENVTVTPGPATVITRREQPVTWVNGNKQVIPLSKTLFSRGLILRKTEQLTLAAASNTVANTQYGDEWANVAKVEVFVNSATLLFSAAGSDLKSLARIMGGANRPLAQGHRPRIQTNLGDGATVNPSLDSTVYIPFVNPRSRRPLDTLLSCPEFSDYRLEVTFASEATPGTAINSAATGYTANPLIEVYQRVQSAPIDPKTGKVMLPPFYRRMLKTPVIFAAANSDFPQKLNTGPIYRGIVMNTLSGGAESHTILTNVKVENGATTYVDQSAASLQAVNNSHWDINEEQFAASTGIWTQSKGGVSGNFDPLSWIFADFCEDGFMSEAIDTQATGDTFVHLNVNAACTVNLFTQELVRIAR